MSEGLNRKALIRSENRLYYLSRKPAHGTARGTGTVVAFTPSGFVTARALGRDVPTEGASVHDARGLLEARVVRVFGPVARPYLLLRPRRAPSPVDGAALLGAEVYS